MTIKTYTASEAKNNFGRLLESAMRLPVAIERHGRRVALVISGEDMEAMEDFYLGMKANQVQREQKYMSTKDSAKYLENILDA